VSDIEYRLAIPEAAAFVALFESTGWDPEGRLTVDAARDALAHTWCAVSAYDHDRLVGTGRVVGDGHIHALLSDVIVDPDYQGRGIGSAIVEQLVVECRRARIFYTQLFAATGVRPFYERLGFVARQDDAPGMQLVETGPAARVSIP
jgi:GNAT superfamily N-acetyltransferase